MNSLCTLTRGASKLAAAPARAALPRCSAARMSTTPQTFNPVNANSMPKSGNVSEKLGTRERFFLEAMKDRRAPPNFHAYPIEAIEVFNVSKSKPTGI
mmetsp:Transcript_9510/g.20116  ORF Transcript_9510/g.20116 Transcript_9510/m.20116 type:complete len:98 (+) Transcript_9510:94-387(+)